MGGKEERWEGRKEEMGGKEERWEERSRDERVGGGILKKE